MAQPSDIMILSILWRNAVFRWVVDCRKGGGGGREHFENLRISLAAFVRTKSSRKFVQSHRVRTHYLLLSLTELSLPLPSPSHLNRRLWRLVFFQCLELVNELWNRGGWGRVIIGSWTSLSSSTTLHRAPFFSKPFCIRCCFLRSVFGT